MRTALTVVLAAAALAAQTPSTGPEWFKQGIDFESQGKYQEAINAYQKALAANTSPFVSRLRIAANHAALGHTDQALDTLDKLASAGWSMIGMLDNEAKFANLRSSPNFEKVRNRVQLNSTPCKNPATPEYRQFDFWVGDWDVFQSGTNVKVGRNDVRLILNDCVVEENWTGTGGGSGKSFNKYNPALKQWEQYWVDGGVGRMFFTGQRVGDEMRFTSDAHTAAGQPMKRRLTFFKNADGTVRQFSEGSTDGGKTFSVEYDFTYRPRGKS